MRFNKPHPLQFFLAVSILSIHRLTTDAYESFQSFYQRRKAFPVDCTNGVGGLLIMNHLPAVSALPSFPLLLSQKKRPRSARSLFIIG